MNWHQPQRQPRQRERPRLEHWGAAKILEASGYVASGYEKAIVGTPPVCETGEAPTVKTLSLSAQYAISNAAEVTDGIFRWKVTTGVGGGAVTYLIDAFGTQQISLPANTWQLSIVLEPFFNGATTVADLPNQSLVVSAFMAEGNVSTAPATYSKGFRIGVGETTMTIPQGARGWRLSGEQGAALSPFTATLEFEMRAYNVPVPAFDLVQQWIGANLATLHNSDGFIPIVGGQRLLRINNTGGAGDVAGAIIFALDL